MAEITKSAVRKVLEAVIDPATAKNVVAQGMVGGIAVRGGHVAVTLDVDPARGTALEPLRQACEQAVRAMPGVLSATAVMTSERPAPRLHLRRTRTATSMDGGTRMAKALQPPRPPAAVDASTCRA